MGRPPLKFFSITDMSGHPLIVLKMDDSLDESLIGGFLAAIYNFGKESLKDRMATISIESPDSRIESYFYDKKVKYPLIAFGLLSKEIPSQLFKKFAETQLTQFVDANLESLNDLKSHVQEYHSFEDSLKIAIESYFTSSDTVFEKKLDELFLRVTQGDLKSIDEI